MNERDKICKHKTEVTMRAKIKPACWLQWYLHINKNFDMKAGYSLNLLLPLLKIHNLFTNQQHLWLCDVAPL